MNIQTVIKTGFRYALTYAVLLAVFVTTLTLVCALPNERIQKNILDSVPQMRQEGLRYQAFGHELSTLDGFTDQLIAEMQFVVDPANPFKAAIVSYREDFDYLDIIERVAAGGEKVTDNYARYWHGYAVWLRPLLMLFNYGQTRIVMNVAFYALLAAVFALLYIRTKVWWSGVPPALALLSVYLFTIPMSWQFFSVFAVALAVCIYILLKLKNAEFVPKLPHVLFISGALTTFIDLTSAPLVACGFPLIISLLVIYRHKYISSVREYAALGAKMVFAWGLGYVILWVSKWVLADAVFRLGTISGALERTRAWTYGEAQLYPEIIWWKAPVFVFEYTFRSFALPAFLFLLALVAFVIWRAVKHKDHMLWVFLGAGLMPVVWFMVAYSHTYVHYFMVFRALSVSIMAIISAFCCALWRYYQTKKKNAKILRGKQKKGKNKKSRKR